MSRTIDFADGFESSVEPSIVIAPASEVSVVPVGNLASDTVQEALEELQADVDTRATASAMTSGDASTLASANTYSDAGDATTLGAANDYTDTALAAMVNAAPATLDTLDELASALGDDPNFATTVSTSLGNRLRVDTDAQGLNGTQKTNAKTNIDLQNVSNTSDMDKPVSTAQAAALATKASLSGSEVLTNKDIDGGTASNTSRITLPKAAKTTLDALTRKAGTIVFDTTTNKPYYDDGTTLQLVGSGSGGTKNYVTNGDAEAGSTGWEGYYKGTPATRPAAASGSTLTPVLLTTSITSTSPLSGSNSWLISKPASNCQSHMLFRTITIDDSDKGKVLQISFDYKVDSGTFQAGSTAQDSDLIVYMYGNGAFVEPSNIKLFSNSTTLSERFTASFQADAVSNVYRICFYVPTTNTAAWTLKVDNIAVSPSAYVYGSPIVDLPDYVPTVVGMTAPTNVAVSATKRGRLLRVNGSFTTGTVNGSTASMSLPQGLTIASSVNNPVSTNAVVGYYARDSVSTVVGTIIATSGGSVVNFSYYGGGTAGPNVAQPASNCFGSGEKISFWFEVPITGWSSSVQMSDSAETRVVLAKVAIGSSVTALANNPIKFNTVVNDTHGAYSATTGLFTAPVSGYYKVSFIGYSNGNSDVYIALNGTGSGYICNLPINNFSSGSTVIFANAGQTIGIYVNAGPTFPAPAAAGYMTTASFERVSGPSQIAASEFIGARYTSAAGQSTTSATDTIINFDTKEYDTHGIVTTGTSWRATAPISGKYRISTMVTSQHAAWTVGQVFVGQLFKNGVLHSSHQMTANASGTYRMATHLNTTIHLNQGDYVNLVLNQSLTQVIFAYHPATFFCIERVGN